MNKELKEVVRLTKKYINYMADVADYYELDFEEFCSLIASNELDIE